MVESLIGPLLGAGASVASGAIASQGASDAAGAQSGAFSDSGLLALLSGAQTAAEQRRIAERIYGDQNDLAERLAAEQRGIGENVADDILNTGRDVSAMQLRAALNAQQENRLAGQQAAGQAKSYFRGAENRLAPYEATGYRALNRLSEMFLGGPSAAAQAGARGDIRSTDRAYQDRLDYIQGEERDLEEDLRQLRQSQEETDDPDTIAELKDRAASLQARRHELDDAKNAAQANYQAQISELTSDPAVDGGPGGDASFYNSELYNVLFGEGIQDRFREDPGYQFAFDEGQRALDRSASARGKLNSGSHERELIRYGQGIADQEYDDYWNRLAGTYGDYANRIASIAGMGQNTSSQLGQAGVQTGANIGNALLSSAQNAGTAGLQGAQLAGNTLVGSAQNAGNARLASADNVLNAYLDPNRIGSNALLSGYTNAGNAALRGDLAAAEYLAGAGTARASGFQGQANALSGAVNEIGGALSGFDFGSIFGDEATV